MIFIIEQLCVIKYW